MWGLLAKSPRFLGYDDHSAGQPGPSYPHPPPVHGPGGEKSPSQLGVGVLFRTNLAPSLVGSGLK
jgi:hypothetical protein